MFFGFVGVGQAGGNIADLAAENGFNSIAINYSQRDLDSLEHVEEKLTLVGSEGVGKQRDVAINLMKNNWESTVEFVKRNMSTPSVDVIMVVFSTAGGSGSGISPFLVEMLSQVMEDKIIVACPILPSKEEVAVNQINTLNTLEQLKDIDVCILPIDNQSIVEKYEGSISKNLIFKEINEKFIGILQQLLSYTERSTKFGVLDKKDLRQLFNTQGVASISITPLLNLSEEGEDNDLNYFIQKSWKKTIFAPIQYEKIMRAGIIFQGNEVYLRNLRHNELFDVFKNQPFDLFEGNYTDNEHTCIISVLVGLGWMHERIKMIDDAIEKQKYTSQNIENNTHYTPKNLGSFDRLFKNKESSNQKKKPSALDMLKKYQNR